MELNAGGRPLTSGLFKIFPDREDIPDAPYDLEIFKTIFFTHMDPSGYLCAREAFTEVPVKQRWDEWKRVFGGNSVLERIHKEWVEEMEIYVRAKATKEIAKGCDPKDFNRLKYLRDGGLFDKAGAGRPKKGQATNAERTAASVANKLSKGLKSKIIDLGDEWRERTAQA